MCGSPTRLGKGQLAFVPVGSGWCDCHVHLEDGTFPAMRAMHRRIGVERVVVVQRFTAGTDTRVLEAALAEDPRAVRGITVIDDRVTDADLVRLHAAGVRGIRLNLGIAHLPGSVGVDAFERACARIAPFGWHAKVLVDAMHLPEFAPAVRRVRVPVVLDHFGLLDPVGGVEQPAFALLMDLLAAENRWVLLAAADRASHEGAPWRDVLPIVSALAAAAPDRTIWGTDWPHSHHEEPLPDAAALMALLNAAVPDPAARRKILIDNPARLYEWR
jgi:2-pyrone-4,6-dicarboxylate lactonase